uniref:Zf_UBZ domain-containing protein n=1 Tax=Macrostomum lignano TaxID=282301 RepID=A0A1I8FI89_9PLAT
CQTIDNSKQTSPAAAADELLTVECSQCRPPRAVLMTDWLEHQDYHAAVDLQRSIQLEFKAERDRDVQLQQQSRKRPATSSSSSAWLRTSVEEGHVVVASSQQSSDQLTAAHDGSCLNNARRRTSGCWLPPPARHLGKAAAESELSDATIAAERDGAARLQQMPDLQGMAKLKATIEAQRDEIRPCNAIWLSARQILRRLSSRSRTRLARANAEYRRRHSRQQQAGPADCWRAKQISKLAWRPSDQALRLAAEAGTAADGCRRCAKKRPGRTAAAASAATVVAPDGRPPSSAGPSTGNRTRNCFRRMSAPGLGIKHFFQGLLDRVQN